MEICSNGVWGTVCDDLWEDVDANVVCRQLGHRDTGYCCSVDLSQVFEYFPFCALGATSYLFARFGQGSGPILLDNVACVGTERRLIDCPANAIGSHNCIHLEDASVSCLPAIVTIPPRMYIVCSIIFLPTRL